MKKMKISDKKSQKSIKKALKNEYLSELCTPITSLKDYFSMMPIPVAEAQSSYLLNLLQFYHSYTFQNAQNSGNLDFKELVTKLTSSISNSKLSKSEKNSQSPITIVDILIEHIKQNPNLVEDLFHVKRKYLCGLDKNLTCLSDLVLEYFILHPEKMVILKDKLSKVDHYSEENSN